MGTLANPIDLAKQAAADFKACYGGDLVSVIVYGSAAGRDFDPKKSDINLLVVLSAVTLAMLEMSISIQRKWMKSRFARPLFVDKEYIAGSLDSFPIEFFAMKDSYHVVAGEDVLAGLNIGQSDLRLQVEREIKGKWLHLNLGWLDSRRSPARLRRLLELSIREFSPIFRALMRVKELPIRAIGRRCFRRWRRRSACLPRRFPTHWPRPEAEADATSNPYFFHTCMPSSCCAMP